MNNKDKDFSVGCIYEFSDLPDFTCVTSLGVYHSCKEDIYGRMQYYDSKGIGWLHIRPVKRELGK